MTETIVVRDCVIGSGRPKICVPIVARTREEILRKARELNNQTFDLVEWRADWYEKGTNPKETVKVLKELREILKEVPILFTFRTKEEGGEQALEGKDYLELNCQAAKSRLADLVDIELLSGLRDGKEEALKEAVCYIHSQGMAVVMSSHDFEKTPDSKVMMGRFFRMEELGADILKIAVMPKSRGDVLTLLSVTSEMADQTFRPLITMAMGPLGVVSRMAGEAFGSAVTFASAGAASAPGQVDAGKLKQVLETLHEGMALRDNPPLEKRIFIIGFMGTGKTTVSACLSHKLGCPSVEMDQRIKEEASMEIKDIFETCGEEHFRDLETGLIRTVGTEPPCVVSCGGGAVLRPENVRMMKASGVVVLLTARPETVLNRVKGDDSRPNLKGRMSAEGIAGLMEKRRLAYERAADLTVETDNRTPDQIAEEILSAFRKKQL